MVYTFDFVRVYETKWQADRQTKILKIVVSTYQTWDWNYFDFLYVNFEIHLPSRLNGAELWREVFFRASVS